MLNISRGIIPTAKRVVIYGPEGVGKTSLAAEFPQSLFIDLERGSETMDVNRINGITTWTELIRAVLEVANTPDCCKTLVIDTLDYAERLAVEKVCADNNIKSIESMPYGKAYTILGETFQKLLDACDKVRDSGKHVLLIAHAKMRKFEQPDEQGSYDRWETKLSRQVAPLVKEWCDLLLFLNFKVTVIKTDKNTVKGVGGRRIMYTNHHPCWDAKNRFNLPDELDLGFEGIAHIFGDVPKPLSPLEELRKRMDDDGISDLEIQKLVSAKGHFSEDTEINDYPVDFIKGWLLPNWAAISRDILDNPTAPF